MLVIRKTVISLANAIDIMPDSKTRGSAAKDLMKKPIQITKKSTVSDVIKKLLDNKISRVVISDEKKPVGIITEKDIGLFLLAEKTKESLSNIPLEKIMKKIAYVDGSESIRDCAKIMIDKKISSLSVGSEDSLQGIFTKTDLAKYYVQNFSGRKKVVDYMTKNYISTHSAAPVSHAIEKMLENKISRIITKNQSNQPIGVLSLRDFFKTSLSLGSDEGDFEDHPLSGTLMSGFLSEGGFGQTVLVGDVMTKGILDIKFNEDLAFGAKTMLENGISGLAVLDGNGGVAGIITKTDITRALSSLG